jgi:hypothetical protein
MGKRNGKAHAAAPPATPRAWRLAGVCASASFPPSAGDLAGSETRRRPSRQRRANEGRQSSGQVANTELVRRDS